MTTDWHRNFVQSVQRETGCLSEMLYSKNGEILMELDFKTTKRELLKLRQGLPVKEKEIKNDCTRIGELEKHLKTVCPHTHATKRPDDWGQHWCRVCESPMEVKNG